MKLFNEIMDFRPMDEWSSFLSGPRKRAPVTARQIKIVDLFSSVGGLTTGVSEALIDAGLSPKPLFAADVDDSALSVYRANWPTATALNRSVRHLADSHVTGLGASAKFSYTPTLTEPNLSSLVGKIDLLVAGPPCQGHSSLNNFSRGDDPRNELYLQVPAIAIALGVSKIIIENVPGVVRSKSNVVDTTASLLEQAGYFVSSGVLAADSLGWPQTRKRFFLVADRESQPLDIAQLQANVQRNSTPKDIMWAMRDLPGHGDTDSLMGTPATLSDENLRRAKLMFEQGLYDLPLSERPDCHKLGTTYTASYGRMRPDQPAPTITTGFLSPGRGRFLHPHLPRTLTPREAARVQGFPDWYSFNPTGNSGRANLAKWIGDAVPPILGYAAAKALGY